MKTLVVKWSPLAGCDAIIAEWYGLAERAVEPNVFYEPGFAIPAATAFGDSVRVALVYSPAGELLGFFPATVEFRYGVPPLVITGWTHPYAPVGIPLSIDMIRKLQRAKVVSARQIATYYSNIVLPQSQRLLQSAERQYNVMQVGVFQLLQARQGQIRVIQEYVNAMTTYWRERARLVQILAGKLPDDADGTAGTGPISMAQTNSGNQ